jgi:hypothetical protein
MFEALERLSPALLVPDDPPLRDQGGLIDVSHSTRGGAIELLRLSRLSGQGGPGTELVLSLRHYDGQNGGKAGWYVLAHVEFFDGSGFRCRTRGTKLGTLDELDDVIRALTECRASHGPKAQ